MTGGSRPSGPIRVALDLLGGDHAPSAVIDGALLVAEERPELTVTLVGPTALSEQLLSERGAAVLLGAALTLADATQVVAMGEDPARAVRAKRDSTVRVAARLVRDGQADATVSVGSTGAALAAASFSLGRLPGVTRAPLAVVVPARAHPVVLLDAGASVDATPDLLVQFALCGAAYARARLGVARPRVGLLSIGHEPGKGDALRREAYTLLATGLAGLSLEFIGNVEGGDVALGAVADVVVTDGFTGNVLLKGMEGALALAAVAPDHARHDVPTGAILLGVDGVVVIGHGASTPRAVADCVLAAADAVARDLVGALRGDLGELVARRRAAAGLPRAAGVQQ